MPTTPLSRSLRLLADLLQDGATAQPHQIDWLHEAADTIEDNPMALKPRPKLKGIPIGGSFKTTDTGKVEPKPKRAKLTLPAQYAAKNKRKWRAAR